MTAVKILQCVRQHMIHSHRPNVACGIHKNQTLRWFERTHSRQYLRNVSFWGLSPVDELNKAVLEAEKIVGYPTSFMSLRCFLSDELSSVALQMRKLVGTNHPLLKTARTFFSDGKHSMQTRGLLVLLMSKVAGPCADSPLDSTETMVSGIYPSQRTLAEITEMIHTAQLIHKGVINLDTVEASNGSVMDDMEGGNKMAVLSGDFLLANACMGLAGLNNTKVVEMVSGSIGDMMKAEFTDLKDINGQSCLPEKEVTMKDWEHQTFLSTGSLIANSCHSALLLARHNETLQEQAFQFGRYTAFAHQLHEDLQLYVSNGDEGENLNVASAPIIIHLAHHPADPALLQLLNRRNKSSIKQLRKMLKRSGAVDEAQQLCKDYSNKALQSLDGFSLSEAKTALQNIVHAVAS